MLEKIPSDLGHALRGVRAGFEKIVSEQSAWLPPDPPSGHGAHRYVFQLFALDRQLVFEHPPGRKAVVNAMRGHVLAKGVLVGAYERV
jgi:phosphatidylethanolamine-binding protein (PEBP) family uncharacterized protein